MSAYEPVAQPMLVYQHGLTPVLACCGPRALALLSNGATRYRPYGEASYGLCCHTGAIRGTAGRVRRNESEWAAVRAALAERKTRA